MVDVMVNDSQSRIQELEDIAKSLDDVEEELVFLKSEKPQAESFYWSEIAESMVGLTTYLNRSLLQKSCEAIMELQCSMKEELEATRQTKMKDLEFVMAVADQAESMKEEKNQWKAALDEASEKIEEFRSQAKKAKEEAAETLEALEREKERSSSLENRVKDLEENLIALKKQAKEKIQKAVSLSFFLLRVSSFVYSKEVFHL